MLRAEEVALMVGCSVPTLNNWYKFKFEHPEHPMSQLLPAFTQTGPRQKRLWNENDVYKLIEFRANLPHGRNGILGSITQRYYRKKEKGNEN